MEPVVGDDADWVSEALGLELARPASAALAQRLYRILRRWVQEGRLVSGQRLPSSRRLARELSLGRNTVLAAIDQLIAEGFLESRPGAGTFVADVAFEPMASQSGEMRPLSDRPAAGEAALSARGVRLLEFCASLDDRCAAFAPGVPALDRFPHETWQRLLRRHLHATPTQWLDYRAEGGVPALREALCDYLRLSRSVRCHPGQILIVQGAQQGFELLARMLGDVGDRVWVEEPGYHGAQACFSAAGFELEPVPVDAEGMSLPGVPVGGASPRLIHVTPSHQYPSGVTMSLARRLALLEVAERHRAWIVEDDYDSEFRYGQRPIAALQGLVDGARVIYVGTFSKVLYPGLRLGYLVLPDPLVVPFRRANARLHREGQYPVQAALAEAAREPLVGPDQALWLERLSGELDNLCAALDACRTGAERVVKGLQLTAALEPFWRLRQAEEGRRQLRIAHEYEASSDRLASVLRAYLKLRDQRLEIPPDQLRSLQDLHETVADFLSRVTAAYEARLTMTAADAQALNASILSQIKRLRDIHLHRMTAHPVNPSLTLLFAGILTDYSRIRAHALNIHEANAEPLAA